jgi:hypothetical protein
VAMTGDRTAAGAAIVGDDGTIVELAEEAP